MAMAPSTSTATPEADPDPIRTYTMSHFAEAMVGDEQGFCDLLERVGAPSCRLMIIQECPCKLRESTFDQIGNPSDVCSLVFSGEGLSGDWAAAVQKGALESEGIDADTFPLLGKGEEIFVDCEARFQFGDTDAAEFCQQHGITDDEWELIQFELEGEYGTDNVYLEL